ncbi:MAG TPA: DinB family protein [Acidisarcina sp.]|nr:DinB family protein [Acidisarcina sp.]
MSIANSLLAEFESQAPVTRRFLERLPADKLTWKPHPKSMSAGQLAYHLAVVPGSVVRGMQTSSAPPPDFQFPEAASVQQVLDLFDESVAAVRKILPNFNDDAMHEMWRIVVGDQEILAFPRGQFIRDVMLNHWYQHRGQFSVYLRLLDVAVPSSWGPSADEPAPFQKQLQPA